MRKSDALYMFVSLSLMSSAACADELTATQPQPADTAMPNGAMHGIAPTVSSAPGGGIAPTVSSAPGGGIAPTVSPAPGGGIAPTVSSAPGGSNSPATASNLSQMAKAAINAAPTIASVDKLSASLDAITVPQWSAQPVQTFVSTANGFSTTGGDSVPPPENASVAALQEYGCTHAFVRRFTRPQRAVQLAVYSFINPYGAYGAYTTMRRGSQTVVIRGDASSEDDRSITFWEGRRLVVISTANDDDEVSKGAVTAIADRLAPAITDHADVPPLLYTLPLLDRVKGSERFFMGPLAARRYITLAHFNRLNMDKAAGEALAEYACSIPHAERLKALVIDYGNADLARRTFAGYTSALSADHKSWLLEPCSQLCKMNGTFGWSGVRDSRIFLVLGARHKESALLLARQMTY